MYLQIIVTLRLQDSVERTIYKWLHTNIIPICAYVI